ncbi:MAG: peptide-methionine (S)-S-oxide reductase MsrA [Flavobacteriales bacterium]|nr:peptide-methionine (S)-S-oxide reductase MsrA [Flavobacteriales bacterium]
MKKNVIVLFLISCFGVVSACNTPEKGKNIAQTKSYSEEVIQKEKLETAYFASGCFWCVEAVFQSVKGVKDAVSGYSGGYKKNPTYREISSGTLKHAEAVKVIYDPLQVDYETLVKVFFGSHDPTTVNRQGPDRGPQYRSIVFYETMDEKKIIEKYMTKLESDKVFSAPIVTEVVAFDIFWDAEDYHQEYENKHPENGYVQSVSIPRLKKFQAKFPELLKENH